MAKIENESYKAPEKAPEKPIYVVEVSFDGLDKGDYFSQEHTDREWADRHVATGYLRQVNGEEPGVERRDVGTGGPVPS